MSSMEQDKTAVSLLFCTGLKRGLYSELETVSIRFKLPDSQLQILRTLVGKHETIPRNIRKDRSRCG